MSAKPPPTDFPTLPFTTAASFSAYLDENHLIAPGIYVKFAKKNSNIPSITPAEAVETALCYGWIDGRANSIDATYWTVRYTPRRAKSIWSQKNVRTIERLLEEGKMKPAGMAQVQAAKSDGRWERAYAGSKDMVVPEDLEAALGKEGREDVRVWWEGLKKGERYPYLFKLATGKMEGRVRKIEGIVEELRRAAGGMEKTSVVKTKMSKGGVGKTEQVKTVGEKQMESKAKGGTSGVVRLKKEAVRREGLRSARNPTSHI